MSPGYYFNHLSDGEITDFVINHRKTTIKEDISVCNWIIFFIKIRLQRGDVSYFREWRDRLITIQQQRDEQSQSKIFN